MILIMAITFAFGALVCYASCVAAARADKQSKEYLRLKNLTEYHKAKRTEEYHGRHFKDE